MRTKLLVTLAAVMSWAVLLVVSRVVLLRFSIDPWTFTFVQLCAGGTVLLLLGGLRGLDFASFANPITWLLGLLRVLSAACYTAVLAWLSVLEAGILGAINIPLAMFAVWLVFGQRPSRGEWLGHVAICAPMPFLVVGLEGGLGHPAVLLMLLNEVCLIAATLLAERHPENVSDRPGARLRFSGAVLLVTAAILLVLWLALDKGREGTWSWPLLVAGCLVGVMFRAPSMVLSFWSMRLIGTRNYLAAIAILPVVGLALEQGAIALGLIGVSRFQLETLMLAIAVLLGTLLVAAMRIGNVRSRADRWRKKP